MSNFTVHRCPICGQYGYEKFMLEYDFRHFCGINCMNKQARKDNEALDRALDRTVVEFRPRTDTTEAS